MKSYLHDLCKESCTCSYGALEKVFRGRAIGKRASTSTLRSSRKLLPTTSELHVCPFVQVVAVVDEDIDNGTPYSKHLDCMDAFN